MICYDIILSISYCVHSTHITIWTKEDVCEVGKILKFKQDAFDSSLLKRVCFFKENLLKDMFLNEKDNGMHA